MDVIKGNCCAMNLVKITRSICKKGKLSTRKRMTVILPILICVMKDTKTGNQEKEQSGG